ncbi:hypothetical protein [Pedobacter endophyticus]|uniref:Uncharacterized protein n=1 Tax=Pedobacter endophyticus TaxID=2789740 RepID=A0A7S9Q0N5_9SPHI|nr:hypothetical protein [Pedobacter endophyticus]QPH40971.1 hypothetical protein IZT61_06835 [Pedobacter endophyticus]
MEQKVRKMAMVMNKFNMLEHDEAYENLNYWLTKSPQERISAVTFLINQTLKPGQRMDKTKFKKAIIRK